MKTPLCVTICVKNCPCTVRVDHEGKPHYVECPAYRYHNEIKGCGIVLSSMSKLPKGCPYVLEHEMMTALEKMNSVESLNE